MTLRMCAMMKLCIFVMFVMQAFVCSSDVCFATTVANAPTIASDDNVQSGGKKIKIALRIKGQELSLIKTAIAQWEKQTGNEVEIVTFPHPSNECFGLCQQWLNAESFDIDAIQMDVAWVGIFSEHLSDLSIYYGENELNDSDYFDSIRTIMHDKERVIAIPWYADCGIMYYRSDLLQKYSRDVPKTWEELYDTAAYIQEKERKELGKNKFFGFVFQAKAFEILTCNFLEILDSFGGAVISDCKVTIDSEHAVNAMQFLIKCVKNISDRSVLNYSEEDSRGAFQSGKVVFMRNWPYAWSLMNAPSTAVSGKIGMMPIPKSEMGTKGSGVLGGWVLTLPKYSKKQKAAANLIKFLTSKAQQKIRAAYSYAPTFKSLYSDPYVLKINPFFKTIYISLENAVIRPSFVFRKHYTRASTEIFNTINTMLTDSIDSDFTQADIQKYLSKLSKRLVQILNKLSDSNSQKKPNNAFFQWTDSCVQKIKEYFRR